MTHESERQPPLRRGRGPRFVFWGVLVLLVGAAAWLLFVPRHPGSENPAASTEPESTALGMRPLTLYFGDEDARTLLSERREVPAGTSLEARVEACMQALIEGPDQHGAVRTLPAGARLRKAFFDDDSATLYLDFNPALVTAHPGGSAAEYFTLSSIVRTLGANFPEVARVQLLVDGQPVESLAGHFDTSKPIEIATWQ
jgi:germination protein M